MKVIHVYPFFNRLGGVEKYLVDTLPELRKIQPDLLLVGGQFDPEVVKSYATVQVPFIRKPLFAMAFIFSMSAAIVVRRIKRQLGHNSPVMIHAQGASFFTPDVITAQSCHKAWFLLSLKEKKPFSKPWLLKLCNPLHYLTIAIETVQYWPGNTKKVIAISQAIKNELVTYFGMDESRIAVIHSGVSCETYHPDKKSQYRRVLRDLHGLKDKDLVMSFVANEFRRKGLVTILKAMAENKHSQPDLHLLVIGRDSPNSYRGLVDELGLTDHVHFIGSTPRVDQYYAASDLFVFPTEYEPFGLVITEAMAAGLPVVVSQLAGAAELVTHGVDAITLKNPFDHLELAGGMMALNSQDVRDRMGANARETALKHQWPAVVEKINQVYASL